MSQAQTAGRAFRVWRIQRQLDSDVDGLSASKQENLGQHLARTDGGGGEAYDDLRAVDSDAADTLAAIDDPVTQRQFVTAYQRGEVDEEELTSAINQYSELGAEPQEAADKLIAETGSGGVRVLNIDVCNGPCDNPVDVASEVGRERDELDQSDLEELLLAVEAGENADVGPGADRGQVVEIIQELHEIDQQDGKNVEGLDELIGGYNGKPSDGYKQIAGESNIVGYLLKNTDIEANDLKISRDVKRIDGGPNDATEYDVDVDSGGNAREVPVNGEFTEGDATKLEDPVFESKHLNPSSYELGGFPNPETEADELANKLVTQVADGEDELVVVTTREYMDEYGEEALKPVRQQVKNEVDADPDIEADGDDLTIRFTTYEDLDN